jgi:ribosome-associated protein
MRKSPSTRKPSKKTPPRPPASARQSAQPAAAPKPAARLQPPAPGDEPALRLGERLAGLLLEKKARQLRLLHVGPLTSYADYLLIATATSERHTRALADHLASSLRAEKRRPLGVEGLEAGQWVLVDFGDVVVHLMQESARGLYDLDGLWIDAAEFPLPADE